MSNVIGINYFIIFSQTILCGKFLLVLIWVTTNITFLLTNNYLENA